jgi:predicted nucleic acid-binding protein
MNLVDSSAWLEYFSDGPNAAAFERALKDADNLLVPTLCLYEVFKVVLRERGESEALQAVALMRQGKVIDLTAEIALLGARTSLDFRIPLADSIILATGRLHGAVIWTQDADFKDIKGVKYIPTKSSG